MITPLAVQVRTLLRSKDLDARKGLRTQNALKAYANAYANAYADAYTNAYAGPTGSRSADCRTNRRKAKEANSFILGKQH